MTHRIVASATVLVAAAMSIGRMHAQDDDFEGLLARSSEYVVGLEKQLEAVIWNESYDQIDRIPKQFGASGGRFTGMNRRQFTAEMLFVWVEANATWLAVRDVITVDGKPVVRRLPALLKKDQVTLRDLRALSDENGRYNIGPIERNFNEPMLAMLFLDARYRARFEFSDGGRDTIDGTPVRKIHFVETRRPTVIRTVDRDVKTKGDIFVAPSDGRVLRTSLEIDPEQSAMRGRIVVEYGLSNKLGVLVPIAMEERYSFAGLKDDQAITCRAIYSDFRRFETGARIVFP